MAALMGNFDVVVQLISENEEAINAVDEDGATALFLTVAYQRWSGSVAYTRLPAISNVEPWEREKMALFLLRNGANVLVHPQIGTQDTVLHFAVVNNMIKVVDFICNNYPDAISITNTLNESPMFEAARAPLVEVGECVFKYVGLKKPMGKSSETVYNQIINAQNNDGDTIMMVAAQCEYWEFVKFLLKSGADPTISNFANDALIHIAAQTDEIGVVIRILNHPKMTKTAINAKNKQSLSAYNLAVRLGKVAIANLLSDYGDDKTDFKESDPRTPLYGAARKNRASPSQRR